jgi:hypothetical protein
LTRKTPFPLAREHHVFVLGLFCVVTGWLGERVPQHPPGVVFTWSAVGGYALLLMLVRLAGSASAFILQRPALSPTLAVQALFWSAPTLLVVNLAQSKGWNPTFGIDVDNDYGFGYFSWIATPLVFLMLIPALRAIAPEAHTLRRFLAAATLSVLSFVPLYASDVWSAFYYSDYEESSEAATTERADAALDYDPEDLLAIQDELVDAQISALAPQRPGVVDLYLVSMAGDGAEDVFRNEAELATSVFDERFGTRGRSLSLINHVDTLPQVPLATRRNLMRTLEGVGRVIDPAEDIVFVFMTSHGSEDHDWLVQLGDVALTQITPDDVLEAYDNAGIRWRVAVVSACYSGGFLDALASPTSLVITSARADRTSFGCGADADLTYFGRAYFAEALAKQPDFVAAFKIARQQIEARERANGFDPSEPQISNGTLVSAQLAQWRDGLKTAVLR